MSTFKKGKVVMLPTNQKTNGMICKDITGQDKTIAIKTKYLMEHEDYIGHHLYIISDDEIKEGDWFLSDSRGTKQESPKYRVEQCIKVENGWIFGHIEGMEVGHNPDWSKQIIATTDTSLEIVSKGINPVYEQLPQPSQQFIEKFVEEYNKGNIITDVMVEYINYPTPQKDGFSTKYSDNITITGSWASRLKQWEVLNNTLKINPKDNTITIKIVKDCYTREEVIDLIIQAVGESHDWSNENNNIHSIGLIEKRFLNKWIEENL